MSAPAVRAYDADSQVDLDWLVHQLRLDAELVVGAARDGRNHGHRADMGFSARAYGRVGGFRALHSGEDVDLAARFEAAGYRIHQDGELSAIAAARTESHAPDGFAEYLRQLAHPPAEDCA